MDRVAEERWPRLLAEAWAALDLGETTGLPPGLVVTGDRGHLPSRLPVEDTAVACAGAALLAAAALETRHGSGARLDRGHVAAAFRSEACLRLNGESVGPGFAPLSRFWPAADGWVRTHANYPWHADALLRPSARPVIPSRWRRPRRVTPRRVTPRRGGDQPTGTRVR